MRIGIDLGGTSVRAASVDDDGRILNICSEPCNARGSEQDVLDQIYRLIEEVGLPGVESIGLGVPSVVDPERGIVYNVANIPSWKEVHLGDLIKDRYGLPVAVNNDCNAFAVGVSQFGEAKGSSSAVCVTLGTGLGSSLVIGGKLFQGHNIGAGEIGSIPYKDHDYETYCSTPYFKSLGTSGKEAAMRAEAGDLEALEIWKRFGENIGDLVNMILFAYDPEMIVFGGSISNAFGLFRESMEKVVATFPYPKSVERLNIVATALQNAGMIGASWLPVATTM